MINHISIYKVSKMDKKIKCERCKGKLIPDMVVTEEGILKVLRCIHCGDIIDDVILQNRKFSKAIGEGGNADDTNTNQQTGREDIT